MLKRITFLITVILITNLNAQEYKDKPWDTRTNFGLFGNVNFNLHAANFKGVDFPNVPSCCPRYETGSGIGFTGGLFYNLGLAEKWELSLRFFYSDLSGTLSKTEPTTVSTIDGNSTSGAFEHTVKGTLASAGLMPLAVYRISDEFSFNFGLRAGYLLSKKFEQKEELTEPSFGTFFGTNSRLRNVSSGDIPNASAMEMAAVAGVSYSMPLNSTFTLFLVPEFFFYYGFTKVGSTTDWTINTFSGGLALKFAPREVIPPKPPPVPPPPPPLPPPPPPPAVPVLNASILAVAVDEDGVESDVTKLKVEQFLSTRMHPVLNYVFFEQNETKIPDRYKSLTIQQKNDFSVKYLYNLKTMDVYHNVLNIVGKRMQQYPQAEITLTGCNSDEGTEKGNQDLSKNRAEAVKSYLTNVWGIEASKIKIQSRNLPLIPSNSNTPEGLQENRRVEMTSNLNQIFEPLIVQDTVIESNPPIFRFKPMVNTPIGIKTWRIITSQSSGELKTFDGSGNPPEKLEWDLSKDNEIVPKLDEPLRYQMEIKDKDNKIWKSQLQTLPVEQITVQKKLLEQIQDKEIDRFSLILFGFDRADLGEENQKIAQFAKKRIQPNSTVSIKGYSDRIGEDNYNRELSHRRAISAAKALGVDLSNAKGLGESDLLYDNDLPEGRFYCRTVNIEIVTPIIWEY